MKLYYAPGSCAIGIHVLMEEIGKPYEGYRLNLAEREHFSPAFTEKNPKSKVPTLERDDGSVLTQFPAIATWLARSNPDKKLMPSDPEGEARTLEAVDYLVSTVHMQGFTRFRRPGAFTANEADHPAVQAQGKDILAKGLALMDKQLEGKEWLTGEYSIADAALFYVEAWVDRLSPVPMPPNCAAHLARMKARPAVAKALANEGLA